MFPVCSAELTVYERFFIAKDPKGGNDMLRKLFSISFVVVALFLTTLQLTAVPVAEGDVVLLGDQTVESNVDNNSAGSAEAFSYTAIAGGTANRLYIVH